jgi:hypothetical protein
MEGSIITDNLAHAELTVLDTLVGRRLTVTANQTAEENEPDEFV